MKEKGKGTRRTDTRRNHEQQSFIARTGVLHCIRSGIAAATIAVKIQYNRLLGKWGGIASREQPLCRIEKGVAPKSNQAPPLGVIDARRGQASTLRNAGLNAPCYRLPGKFSREDRAYDLPPRNAVACLAMRKCACAPQLWHTRTSRRPSVSCSVAKRASSRPFDACSSTSDSSPLVLNASRSACKNDENGYQLQTNIPLTFCRYRNTLEKQSGEDYL